ncbi:MAG: hypothetical protein M0025_09550, partial [Elusimicrobia bacterium]|nr:hypothetical protein [Elusimicrobiota bacterium]
MKKPLLPLLLAASLPAAAWAADFTYMRPCVRANGAGSAFSTVEGDPCAVFYNPANLTTLSGLEVRLETARRLSPTAPLGESSLVYIRPVPDVQYKTAGFGYYAVRRKAASLDSFTFGTGKRTTIKYLQKPLFYGGSFKLVSLREEKSHLAIGVEGGVKLEGSGGLRTALVFSDLLLGAGRSLLTITLGNSYRLGNTELLADLRARGSYSELFLGAEHTAFNGLLQLRAGKGLTLEGGQYLSLGAGVNLS